MREATIGVLNTNIIEKCSELGIDIYSLHNSQRNVLAFSTCNHRNREFEIFFLRGHTYRICTRYMGYVEVMKHTDFPFTIGNDPDGRRKRFGITVDNTIDLNHVINEMLISGFSETPHVELI